MRELISAVGADVAEKRVSKTPYANWIVQTSALTGIGKLKAGATPFVLFGNGHQALT